MQAVLGIDVGTQGVRCIVADPQGNIAASASRPFDREASLAHRGGWHEQIPERWWSATVSCLTDVLKGLNEKGIAPQEIAALSVDSTSGTILPIDAKGKALRPAIMYNDGRASAEAEEINRIAGDHCRQHGYKFSSSYALAKILWMKRHEPAVFDKAHLFIHATDYIMGQLTGNFATTDVSSALKTGCDLFRCEWPAFIESGLGIPLSKLPRLVAPGAFVAAIHPECAKATGLSPETRAVAGMTDGTAGFLSSGASQLGDFNSTLGTTLVVKGISDRVVVDPKGRLYSHRHPSGYWLPGGASNVGGECLAKQFAGKNLAKLDEIAIRLSPTGVLTYPLEGRGERFPFSNKDASGFQVGQPRSEEEHYASLLEGVGYVERMCYEVLRDLGVKVNERIFATGGGSKSRQWLQIRADILNRPIARPEIAESAFGCCILAAGQSLHPDLSTATRSMVRFTQQIYPRSDRISAYEGRYQSFKEECRKRGYIV